MTPLPHLQLWYAQTSPFARKVRITAHELGIANQIELVESNPWTDEFLRKLNPLAKVPTLVINESRVLVESSVIGAYLNSLVPDLPLTGNDPETYWLVQSRQAMSDGAMIAAGRLFADQKRLDTERSAQVMRRQAEAIDKTLNYFEAIDFGETIDFSHIALGCLLGYLDFRWPSEDWRAGRPRLTSWLAKFELRDSARSTVHATKCA